MEGRDPIGALLYLVVLIVIVVILFRVLGYVL